MTLSDSIAWMEVPDARKSIGGLPALSYFLDGCFDFYRAGVRRFILSSVPEWFDGTWGTLFHDTKRALPKDAGLISGYRPLPKHLTSMWDIEGWKAMPLAGVQGTIILDMEVIFQSGRFESIDLNGWYHSLMALPKDVTIWWNFPAILPNDDQSPRRLNDTSIMCRLIQWLRPNDLIMDSSVAWASGSDVLVDSWNQRREWMMQLGEDRILDRILIAPDAAPHKIGDAHYYTTTTGLEEIANRGDRPQVIWTDAERWVDVAAEMREAVTGGQVQG